MSELAIYPVDRLDLSFTPKPWLFAVERRQEIDDYFAALKRSKPAVWNGRVLLMHHHAFEEDALRGAFLETDFASFAAWRAWGRPPAGVCDSFGAAAIIAADGAVLLGVMAPHTASAGRIYFPCGTPDPSDIADGKVDFDFSVRRELKEETGLDTSDFCLATGWTTVVGESLVAAIKVLRSRETADALRARLLAYLAREQQPELSDIRIVRGPADFDLAMPRFVTAFLGHHFGPPK